MRQKIKAKTHWGKVYNPSRTLDLVILKNFSLRSHSLHIISNNLRIIITIVFITIIIVVVCSCYIIMFSSIMDKNHTEICCYIGDFPINVVLQEYCYPNRRRNDCEKKSFLKEVFFICKTVERIVEEFDDKLQ